MVDMTHKGLCDLAVKWLKRPNSAHGHGCNFAAAEPGTGRLGEIPDAYGFRCCEWNGGSVVVEVKVSRADFLADRKKPHRQAAGMGNWRYFLCPEGMIKVDDLPAGWGLLWVNKRGHIKVLTGAAASFAGRYDDMVMALSDWRQEANQDLERSLMAKMLSRVSDPDQVNRWIREANAETARIRSLYQEEFKANKQLRTELQLAQNRQWEGESPIARNRITRV